MEAKETNAASTPPTGRLALAVVIVLGVGVGLLGLSIFTGQTLETHRDEVDLVSLLGTSLSRAVGAVVVYLVAPVLGLIAVLMAWHKWQDAMALAAQGSPALRLAARRFRDAAILLAAVPFLPLLAAILLGMALRFVLSPLWFVVHASMALVALAMGWVSLGLYWRIPGRRFALLASVGVLLFGLASLTGTFFQSSVAAYLNQRQYDRMRQATFTGDSARLEQTAIVPTLDSPSPPGKNVIWCSSFQLAWNEIRDNVIGAPLQVVGAQPLADRLNKAPHRASDLEPGSIYAAGGWMRNGIVDRIEKDMAARFPARQLPYFNDYEEMGGILAYSYLTAHVPFKYPFRQMDGGFTFTDSGGVETEVGGFGLWQAFLSRYEKTREQIEVLYVLPEDPKHPWTTKEYALDLCRHSKPYQVVVAVVEPKGTLAETYEHLQHGIEQFRKQGPRYEHARWFQGSDELRVPELFYRLDHRFAELIDKMVANVGMPIVEAMQTIEFRLDRSGALLESQALVGISATPREFFFDRPFLIYMKKRDAARPFFVMWVDNAELLARE